MPGTKRGLRLASAIERLRKLLSTMGEAAATAENLIDGIDAPLKLTRDELGALCAEPLARLRELLDGVLSTALLAESPLDAVEVLGGGCRMPIVQKVLVEALGAAPCAAALADKPLGAKLDDSHRVLMTTDDH